MQQQQRNKSGSNPAAAATSSQPAREEPVGGAATAPPPADAPAKTAPPAEKKAVEEKIFDVDAELDQLFDALDRGGQGHLEEEDTREIETTLAEGWPVAERTRLLALLRPSGGMRAYRSDFRAFFTEATLFLYEQLVKGAARLSGEQLREVSRALGLEHEPMVAAGFTHFTVGEDLAIGLPKDNWVAFLLAQLASISRKATAVNKVLYLAGSRPLPKKQTAGPATSKPAIPKKKKKKKLSPIPTIAEPPVGLAIKERMVAAPPKPMLNAGPAGKEKKRSLRYRRRNPEEIMDEIASHEVRVTKLSPDSDPLAELVEGIGRLQTGDRPSVAEPRVGPEEEAEEAEGSTTGYDDSPEGLIELLEWANQSDDSDAEGGRSEDLPAGLGRVYELLNAWWTPRAWRAARQTRGLGWTKHHDTILSLLEATIQDSCLALGRPKEVGRRQFRVILESLDCGGVRVPSLNKEEKAMLGTALLHYAVDAEKDTRAFLAPAEGQLVDPDNHQALMELLWAKPPELVAEAEEDILCAPCFPNAEGEGEDSDGSVDDDEYRRMLEEVPDDRSDIFIRHGTPDGSEASAGDRDNLDSLEQDAPVQEKPMTIPKWCEEVD